MRRRYYTNSDADLSLTCTREFKINPKDVVFTAKDKNGQVVWLENGNATKGLEHIKKHTDDFVAKHNIKKEHLVCHLKNVIKNGVVVHSQEKILSNGKKGLEKNIFI